MGSYIGVVTTVMAATIVALKRNLSLALHHFYLCGTNSFVMITIKLFMQCPVVANELLAILQCVKRTNCCVFGCCCFSDV